MTGLLHGLCAVVCGEGTVAAGVAEKLRHEGASLTCVGDAEALAGAVASLGALDILVIDPLGAASPLPLEQVDPSGLAATLAAPGRALAAMQAGLPALRARPEGRIIVIGHHYGEDVAEGIGAYNIAAWSLVGLVRTAAVEWGRHSITTNLVLPLAETPELSAARERRPGVISAMTGQLPLQRTGDPMEDIGGAVAFLASPYARFINGQVVHADGGQHIAAPVLNPARFV